MALPFDNPITEEAYLALEQNSDLKYEYANGYIIAMAGASWTHNLICSNLITSFNNQLADRDCWVTASDMRLKVVSSKSYRYPDVMVICDEPQFAGKGADTISNPVVIVEVLSDSTALTDRNEKLKEYLKIAGLHAYLLVSQKQHLIERYLRQTQGNWLYTQVESLQSQIELPDIDCILALSDVYRKVTLET